MTMNLIRKTTMILATDLLIRFNNLDLHSEIPAPDDLNADFDPYDDLLSDIRGCMQQITNILAPLNKADRDARLLSNLHTLLESAAANLSPHDN